MQSSRMKIDKPTASWLTFTTTIPEDTVYTYTTSYYVALPLYITLMIINTWILISLVHYGIKNGKWRFIQSNQTEKLSSGMIYTSVVICSGLSFLFNLISITSHFSGYDDNDEYKCNVESDLLRSVYALVVFTVTVFLWL